MARRPTKLAQVDTQRRLGDVELCADFQIFHAGLHQFGDFAFAGRQLFKRIFLNGRYKRLFQRPPRRRDHQVLQRAPDQIHEEQAENGPNGQQMHEQHMRTEGAVVDIVHKLPQQISAHGTKQRQQEKRLGQRAEQETAPLEKLVQDKQAERGAAAGRELHDIKGYGIQRRGRENRCQQ